MKFVNGLLSCAFAFCVAGNLMALDEPKMEKKVITGAEADSFMNAMEASGVVDTDKLIGAKNLKAQELKCSEVVYRTTLPKCSLSFNSQILAANLQLSKIFFDTLKANGGRVRSGRGVRKGLAKDIHCVRPVVPNPQAHCSFYVKARNNSF